MHRRKLPIGIQTFAKIRAHDHYYVDKTGFIRQLLEEGTHYFLSRPRRFGKSLLLDTLGELFAGNVGLFEGLAIHPHWDWTTPYPVVRLSFGGGVVNSREALDDKIREQLRVNQSALGLVCSETGIDGRFAELIRLAHAATGRRVAVLVDEYDKPILDNLTTPDLARAIRDGLRNLYSVIKDNDAHIRFAFITGVSKFSKVSLFSGLNNLNDITLDARYSALCGYTEADVETVFAPELEGLDRDEIRRWYNGYNWTGEAVYNPFDLLLLFRKREFRTWWFETGTPTFLVDLITERQRFLPELGQLESDEALLGRFDVGDISVEALMFQTGYLTIDRVETLGENRFYRLRYPNREVFQALNASLLHAWLPDPRHAVRQRMQLYRLLERNDFAGLRDLFTAIFAGIPGDWHRRTPLARYEGYYASIFYACFAALGLDLTPEESSNAGRLDLALHFNGQVYLFEFKVVELEPEGLALQQIKDRGYADKYRAAGQSIHLIGVEFSRERRGVVGFEVETLRPPAA